MDIDAYLCATSDYIEEHYIKVLDEIETDLGINLKKSMSGGKRFRPILTILSCQTCGGRPENAIDFAVALELIHNATLFHDDVLDQDEKRRGKPAMWMVATIGRAILSGDATFAQALNLITKYGPKVTSIGAQTIYALCKGAVKEAINKFPSADFGDPYIEIATLKTASLFSTATRLGAISTYAPLHLEDACGNYGKNLGMAYQLTDDYVDLKKSIITGKPIGDLRDRRVTFPLFCLYMSNERLKRLVPQFALGTLTFEQILSELKNSGDGEQKCLSKINEYVIEAQKSIQPLPDSKYKQIMLELPSFMVKKMMEEI
ncbi:MAG: polyprenyl synthetase family protein [Candidatus Thermoplasmatota archaeon]